MRMPGYGETQPRLDDDRMPVILVTLDGLGDRPVPELSGRTPAEAARTPVLDRLTARGSSGWHIPFGWGRAPASELAHWAMFGYSDIPFPGRAVLEGVGAGIDLPLDAATTFAALRTSCVQNGQVWITGRVGKDDAADADRLFEELAPLFDKADAQLHPVGRGEAVLVLPHHTRGDVTDSDPFFEDFHPWLQVTSAGPEATDLAERLNELLLTARRHLLTSPVNAVRAADGRPALDVMTTKWSGSRRPVPDFLTHAGVAGAAVTSTRLYRGIAGLLGMRHHHLPPATDHGVDMTTRIEAAEHLIDEGARFVHIHTKATDEAGHTKQPRAKLDVLEALDPAFERFKSLSERAIVAITGDHATPSADGVLHTADPTPLLVVGPTVRPDAVTRFGESFAHRGWYGTVAARDLLPLLFGHANRPVFLGHRATPRQTLALPDSPAAMPAG